MKLQNRKTNLPRDRNHFLPLKPKPRANKRRIVCDLASSEIHRRMCLERWGAIYLLSWQRGKFRSLSMRFLRNGLQAITGECGYLQNRFAQLRDFPGVAMF